ncbi:alpha-E domain-containing protein [Salinicola sp. JS01]|uniref:alpha-E domain-containing protein n=1 Tax=Salinicola sp. JS01 TaxID=3050071 RepID=UPI00255B6A9B|nr:alpha-E domain-containing protein [Salinicola sp. JS01]WIX34537.1 alpha-E domain-containing protein [Salinicola sp. JS01]
MLSRVAENLYWMARYVERAEDTARLISVNSNLMLDMPARAALSWSTLIDITGSEETFDALYSERSERNVIDFLCLSREHTGSILSSLANARENLRTTRDVVPREIWEEINQCYLEIQEQTQSGLKPRHRDAFLKSVVRACQTLTGLIEGTLSHTEARTFLSLGRHLERADMTTRILDVRSDNLLPRNPEELIPFEHLQWMSVLKSLTAYQMYRQAVRLRVRGPDVLRFLLQDHDLPRSVLRSLEEVSWELQTLPNHDRPLAVATLVRAEVAEADVQTLARAPEQLHQLIDEFQIGFNNLHEAIASAYFVVRPVKSASTQERDLGDDDD